jgi:hypothetical protein
MGGYLLARPSAKNSTGNNVTAFRDQTINYGNYIFAKEERLTVSYSTGN